jgi:hypothetical protein
MLGSTPHSVVIKTADNSASRTTNTATNSWFELMPEMRGNDHACFIPDSQLTTVSDVCHYNLVKSWLILHSKYWRSCRYSHASGKFKDIGLMFITTTHVSTLKYWLTTFVTSWQCPGLWHSPLLVGVGGYMAAGAFLLWGGGGNYNYKYGLGVTIALLLPSLRRRWLTKYKMATSADRTIDKTECYQTNIEVSNYY